MESTREELSGIIGELGITPRKVLSSIAHREDLDSDFISALYQLCEASPEPPGQRRIDDGIDHAFMASIAFQNAQRAYSRAQYYEAKGLFAEAVRQQLMTDNPWKIEDFVYDVNADGDPAFDEHIENELKKYLWDNSEKSELFRMANSLGDEKTAEEMAVWRASTLAGRTYQMDSYYALTAISMAEDSHPDLANSIREFNGPFISFDEVMSRVSEGTLQYPLKVILGTITNYDQIASLGSALLKNPDSIDSTIFELAYKLSLVCSDPLQFEEDNHLNSFLEAFLGLHYDADVNHRPENRFHGFFFPKDDAGAIHPNQEKLANLLRFNYGENHIAGIAENLYSQMGEHGLEPFGWLGTFATDAYIKKGDLYNANRMAAASGHPKKYALERFSMLVEKHTRPEVQKPVEPDSPNPLGDSYREHNPAPWYNSGQN